MANPDWYPRRLADRPPWHSTFSAQCSATGPIHGLTAPQIAQTGLDNILVTLAIDFDDELRGYVQAWTRWRDLMLSGDPNAPFTPPPTPPTLVLPDEEFLPGAEARTRRYANTIKGDADYTPAVGKDYGIVAPEPTGPGTPEILRATALIDSDVTLKLFKAGYSVLAVDMRRAGGQWTQIGISQTSTFTDETEPLVEGAPEQREYRIHGMVANNRVGEVSAIVSVVTMP